MTSSCFFSQEWRKETGITRGSPEDVTLITGFIDIGSFTKGRPDYEYNPTQYINWLNGFRNIQNPMIGFFEKGAARDKFLEIRQHLASRTLVIEVNRTELWAFSNIPAIRMIMMQPSYPKYFPNTVVSGYPAATSAKYEYVKIATEMNTFDTKYTAWMDIGYLRHNVSNPPEATLHVLPQMFDDVIPYLQVGNRIQLTSTQIFHHKYDYVAGGFFIGTTQLMNKWARQYMEYMDYFLEKGLVGADQQVVYAMITCKEKPPPYQLQPIHPATLPPYGKGWFNLGWACLNSRTRKTT